MITKQQVMKMTTKEKLLELARFLVEEVESKWFDLGTFAEKGFTQKKCGTTACAAGWATVCFPKSGLKLKLEDEWGDELTLVYKEHYGFEAAAAFFGIVAHEAYYLFEPGSYYPPNNKRRNVAKRLREVAQRYHENWI